MINLKTILSVAAVAAGGSLIFGGKKFGGYKNVIDNLQFNIKNIKGVKLQGSEVVFDTDVEIVNPTATAINVPGELIVVRTLHFFTPSGTKIGVATPNVSNIAMPANGSRIITNIPARVSLTSVGKSFSEVLNVVLDPDKLKVTADIEAFGKSFTVNN